MEISKIVLIVFLIIFIVSIIAYILVRISFNQIDINQAVAKQQQEDKRIKDKYNITTYEDEKRRNAELKAEYEMLKLQEENKKLEEEISRMKYAKNKTDQLYEH